MPTALLTLPVEILDVVSSFSGVQDVLSLRLACTGLNHKLLHYVKNYCYNTMCTDLSKTNLDDLEAFIQKMGNGSRVHALSIKHLSSSTDQPVEGCSSLGRGFKWSRDPEKRLQVSLPGLQKLSSSGESAAQLDLDICSSG